MRVVYPFDPIEFGFRQVDPPTRSRTKIYGRVNGGRVERILMCPNFRRGTAMVTFELFYFSEMSFYGFDSPIPTTVIHEEFDQNGKPTHGGTTSYIFNNYIKLKVDSSESL